MHIFLEQLGTHIQFIQENRLSIWPWIIFTIISTSIRRLFSAYLTLVLACLVPLTILCVTSHLIPDKDEQKTNVLTKYTFLNYLNFRRKIICFKHIRMTIILSNKTSFLILHSLIKFKHQYKFELWKWNKK